MAQTQDQENSTEFFPGSSPEEKIEQPCEQDGLEIKEEELLNSSLQEEAQAPCEDSCLESIEEELLVSGKESEELSQEDEQQESQEQEPIALATEEKQLFSIETLKEKLSLIASAEEKLQKIISFMEEILSQPAMPHFKTFWEARNLSLELFKEDISSSTRFSLWAKYQELSKEARRLKELFDEQSQFAAEQIEIAIAALENDISQFSEYLGKMAPIEFPAVAPFFQEELLAYDTLQKEINLLNVQASRIGSLRKELVKTQMRIRTKNKFFQRLSAAGDKVFPRRKELIKELSDRFALYVTEFVKKSGGSAFRQDSLLSSREAIKSLQAVAKTLAVNTAAFTQTRKLLSEFWDALREQERERKKERVIKKSEWDKNSEEVEKRIDELQNQVQSHELPIHEANRRIDEIVDAMRKMEMGRDNLKRVRQKLNDARQPILDEIKVQEKNKQDEVLEKARIKKQKLQELKTGIEELLLSNENSSLDDLTQKFSTFTASSAAMPMSKSEKMEIDRLFKKVRDAIAEKKEQSLLTLSEDDVKTLQEVKEVLSQKKQRRNEIKEQIKQYKKANGSSGLDFEQAIYYKSQISAEEERLEKIDQGIKEMELHLSQLQGKA